VADERRKRTDRPSIWAASECASGASCFSKAATTVTDNTAVAAAAAPRIQSFSTRVSIVFSLAFSCSLCWWGLASRYRSLEFGRTSRFLPASATNCLI